ncbi:MAG: efflux RND transporter periplasmic adaptor subunit [Gammaproteobacteria bacterium]|nr:efflux RND transporter periplasmic adaptor subunit [Gammaproteobacteria bacterium]
MKLIRTALFAVPVVAAFAAFAAGADDDAAAPAKVEGASVAVTTAMPRRKIFEEDVGGYGQLVGDPRATRHLSLPQPGLVARLDVIAGDRVRSGQPLLRLASDPSAQLAYAQAQHGLQQARAELKQAQNLYRRQLATQAQLAAAHKALEDARSALAAQEALGGVGGTTLRAPADGVVESLAVHPGDRVAAGAPLLVLAPTHGVQARIGVDPSRAAAVRVGDGVALTSVFGGAALQGRVAAVAGAIDSRTHLINVTVTLPQAAGLPLATAVDAKIRVRRQPAWAVPRGAVLTDDRGAYLFQVAGGVARRIDVTLVVPAGKTVGVDGPLDARRPVVVLGAYELHDGMKVRTR